jgi:hypothetical protein
MAPMTVTLCMPEGVPAPFCTTLLREMRGDAASARSEQGQALRREQAHNQTNGEETGMSTNMTTATRRSTPRTPARRRVVCRLWNTAEQQVAEIEARLAAGGDPAALERDAKTFAIIARTVRDLVAIDAEAEAQTQEKRRPHAAKDARATPQANNEDSDFASRDIEEFRAELARRLDALRAQRGPDSAS